MAGTLTINSSGDGSLLSGHSWIEYQPDGGAAHTYGTWGNDPMGQGNGLHEDLELGRTGDAQRTVSLDDAEEQQLMAKIEEYRKQGADGWGYLSPCSTFAADAWQAATGENLATRSYGVISNPSKLRESIDNMNKENPEPVAIGQDAADQPGSRRSVGSSTQSCPLRSGAGSSGG